MAAKNEKRDLLVEILKAPAKEWDFETEAEKLAWVAGAFAKACEAAATAAAEKKKRKAKKKKQRMKKSVTTPFNPSSR
jgi:hypothetical protein